MKKELTIENLENALKNASQNLKGDCELSLDDLERVSGGWTSTNEGDTIIINLTEEEYQTLKPLLDLPIAQSIKSQYGLDGIEIERTMVLPREQGEKVIYLLSLFFS